MLSAPHSPAATAPAFPATAARARVERNWRFKYARYFKDIVLESLKSTDDAVNIAQAGVDAMHETFDFNVEKKGTPVPFREAMEGKSRSPFKAARIEGKKASRSPLAMPYRGQNLTGDEIVKQAKRWAKAGTIEQDAADVLEDVAKDPKWLKDGLKNTYFVMIGAGSAMGPYTNLLKMGANVIALDIPGRGWPRLLKIAREESAGRVIFPVAADCKGEGDWEAKAGANLLTQTPQIKDWLLDLKEVKDKKNTVIVGNYTYLDSDLHVRLSIGADAIMAAVLKKRPKDKTGVAFLHTHRYARHHARGVASGRGAAFRRRLPSRTLLRALFESFLTFASQGAWLVPNVWRETVNDKEYNLVDGLSVAQGPNYALAKRLQHWRAVLAYENGNIVSSNVAPSTATASVVHVRTFAWAYGGMPFFKPYEIFEQETTQAVMCAAFLNDALNPKAQRKKNAEKKDENPLELFSKTSYHGGVWRAPYKVSSIGPASVLIYFLGGPSLVLPVATALFAAAMGHAGGVSTTDPAVLRTRRLCSMAPIQWRFFRCRLHSRWTRRSRRFVVVTTLGCAVVFSRARR